MPSAAEARGEAKGYEVIGRIVVAFSALEAKVRSAILRDNAPRSAFPEGPLDADFGKRWGRWCDLQRAWCSPQSQPGFDALGEDVLRLSQLRNDLAHNVIWVSGSYSGTFAVGTHRLPPTTWRKKFRAWAAQIAQLSPTQKRPPAPQGRSVTKVFSEDELVLSLADIEAARDRVGEINDAAAGRRMF